MFGQIFSSIGGFLGNSFGGGILSTIGRFAGKMLGNYLERLNYEPEEYYHFKNIKESFLLSSAKYGESIPLVFGLNRIDGKIIWATRIKKVQNHINSKYFGNSSKTVIHHNIEYEYFISFAVAICEGKISEISRVWANNNLINLGDFKFRLYDGSETQEPDPLIVNDYGICKTPAFRGLAYIVLEALPLSEFGNMIPKFSFEVTRKANIPNYPSVEDLVKSIVMIPGSGEYVYDTKVQYKILKNQHGVEIEKKPINSHNHRNIANSIHSLDQLKLTCSNVEWIAVVTSWFGNSLNAEQCSIMPAIEFNDQNSVYSEEWRVGKYTRSTAKVISRDKNGNPRYGGSVNDASVIRYLEHLRSKNLKIMFYPMIFLDVIGKSWRGHLTGKSESIQNFFNKEDGYNNFILHYARLVKDHVDAFVIGSELIGLTKVRNTQNNFPAVDELATLAKIVKEIVGEKVLVTYAADWSEYHHTTDGWYNLDKLFASPYIDFVGIDAYFPVTNSSDSNILYEDMIKGWESGEGYDYYLSQNKRIPLSADYAWKNVKHWWETTHKNPDNQQTQWKPKMKKIWFTEFGFPSIDKATNQPNIFFDPQCSDGGVPKYSSGEVDFSIQRRAIKAFIEYWGKQEYIGQMFLWTWDARPYPAWPHMNIWQDGYLWSKGHWVNNKFGSTSLAAIIAELSLRGSISLENIDVTTLDEIVEGVVYNRNISIIDAINNLRLAYFFDITANKQKKITFVKRGQKKIVNTSSKSLVKLSKNGYINCRAISKAHIISKLELYFIDHCNDYTIGYLQLHNENFSNQKIATIKLPLVFSSLEADRLGKLILQNALNEDKIVQFKMHLQDVDFVPTGFISLEYLDHKYMIRVVEMRLDGLIFEITGIFDDASSYYSSNPKSQQKIAFETSQELKFMVLDLPFIHSNRNDSPYLAIILQSDYSKSLYVSFSDDSQYTKIANIKPQGQIGKILSFKQNLEQVNLTKIDSSSNFTVLYKDLEKSVKIDDWNLALWGEEIIRFKQCNKVGNNIYQINILMRGEYETREFIKSHSLEENFILIDDISTIPVSETLDNKLIRFKVGDIVQKLEFKNKSQKLLPPMIEECVLVANMLKLKWQVHRRMIDDEYVFTLEIKDNNKSLNFTTDKAELVIDWKDSGLSGELIINIIYKTKDGKKCSNPISTQIKV